MKQHQYTDANLRAASPEHCKHPVGGAWQETVSYGRVYAKQICPLCKAEFNRASWDL